MMERLTAFSRTPHCIMAVDSFYGGRWLSPLPGNATASSLLTPVNAGTSQGAFAAVNPAKAWSVRTGLDLRGYRGGLTVVAKASFGADNGEAANGQVIHPIVNQGFWPSGAAAAWGMALYFNNQRNEKQLGFNISTGERTTWCHAAVDLCGQTAVVAGSYDTESGALQIYSNGTRVYANQFPVFAGIALNNRATDPLMDDRVHLHQRQGGWQNFADSIHAVLIFNRVFSAPEIAALTHVLRERNNP